MLTMGRMSLVRTLEWAGMIGVVAGLCVWGYVLFGTATPMAEDAPSPASPSSDPAIDTITQWLTPGPIHIAVQSSGLMLGGRRGVAVLSVNGGAPRVYAVGDRLADGVTVQAIGRDVITVDRAGEVLRIAAPELPAIVESGITRRSSRSSSAPD